MSQESRPPAIVIRPMGVGEVLDGGFTFARNHYKQFVIIGAWGIVPGQVLNALVLAFLGTGDDVMITATLGLTSLIASVFAAFGATLAFFALVLACKQLIDPSTDGPELTPSALYRASVKRLGSWILFTFFLTFMAILMLIPFPLLIWVFMRWSMSAFSLIAEKTGPIASIRRSWRLTAGAWWHTAAILFITGLIIGILQSVITGLFAALGAIIGGIGSSGGIGVAVSVLGTTLSSVLFTPFSVAIFAVLFYELRARNEGFDLAQRAHQLALQGE
jgi:hypothetical protein